MKIIFLFISLQITHLIDITSGLNKFLNTLKDVKLGQVYEGIVPVRKKNYNIYFRVVGPTLLDHTIGFPIPVLVCHGGPGVPSDYLWPLANEKSLSGRCFIFFDQLGCGRSDVPVGENHYSIEQSIDDIFELIEYLDLKRFHLYGQSFGGILAYETARRLCMMKQDDDSIYSPLRDVSIASLALSSSPCSVMMVEAAASELSHALLEQNQEKDFDFAEEFRIRYQCRTQLKPAALVAAYEKAADPSIGWRGSAVVRDYVVKDRPHGLNLPPALVTRGEYDFVTDECIRGWAPALSNSTFTTLQECSHHGLLEDPSTYSKLLTNFWSQYE